MTDHPPGDGNSGLLFSDQPPPPGMLGERNKDSVLFDVKQLDVADDGTAAKSAQLDRIAKGGNNQPPGSGLIDVRTLASAGEGADAPPPVIEPEAVLVAEIKAQPVPVPIEPPASTFQRVLFALSFLAIIGVAVFLAIEAAG